jgi:hypothetical protein
MAMIGIKLADGNFYPVLEEAQGKALTKRLILSTAYNEQRSAQIDFFRNSEKAMRTAVYIGSVVVDNIKASADNQLELILSSRPSSNSAPFNEVSAEIVNLATGGRYYLEAALEMDMIKEADTEPPEEEIAIVDRFTSKDDEDAIVITAKPGQYETVAEELPANEAPPADETPPEAIPVEEAPAVEEPVPVAEELDSAVDEPVSAVEEIPTAEELEIIEELQSVQAKEADPEENKPSAANPPKAAKAGRSMVLLIVAAACGLVALAAVLVYLFVIKPSPAAKRAPAMGEVPIPKSAEKEPSFDEMFPAVPEPVRPQQSVAAVPEPPPAVSPAASVAAAPEPPPAAPAAAPPAAPPEASAASITHKVRWGDTLWDIAAKYYGDPWLYRRIAKENGLTNANKLVSGTVVKIPPR